MLTTSMPSLPLRFLRRHLGKSRIAAIGRDVAILRREPRPLRIGRQRTGDQFIAIIEARRHAMHMADKGAAAAAHHSPAQSSRHGFSPLFSSSSSPRACGRKTRMPASEPRPVATNAGGRLREAHGSLRVHLVVECRYEAGIESIAAASGIDDLDIIGRALEPRAVAMRVESAFAAQCEDAAGAP